MLFADLKEEDFFVWQSLKELCWRSATSIKRILGLPIIFYTDICEHMCLWFRKHWRPTNASKCSNMQHLPSGLKIWITVSGWNAWPSSPTTRTSKGSSATIWKYPRNSYRNCMLEGLLPSVPTGPPIDLAQIINIVISPSVQSQQTPGILDNYKTMFADWNEEIFFVWQSLKKLC